MAENESKGGFNLPWVNMVALLAAAGGIFTLIPTLDTSRPHDPGGELTGIFGDQNVDTRLWQDPFEEVLKEVSKSRPEDLQKQTEHQIVEFRESMKIKQEADKDSTLWVLFAMVNSGPHADPRERRLRARTAIVEGLSASRFAPVDSSHIGYLYVPWARKSSTLFQAKLIERLPPKTDETAEEKPEWEPLPFEWFERRGTAGSQKAVVIYIEEDACRDRPFSRLAWLSKQLQLAGEPPNLARRVKTTVLGPATSTVLERMVREATEMRDKQTEDETQRAAFIWEQLRDVEIYCPTATASDGALVPDEAQRQKLAKEEREKKQAALHRAWEAETAAGRHPEPEERIPEPPDAKIKDWVSEIIQRTFSKDGLVFQRTIANDRDIVWETIRELQRRGINPTLWAEDPKNPGHLIAGESIGANCKNSVAIISELDTYYGRALPMSFIEQCDEVSFKELALGTAADKAQWIHPFHYLRGLDGRLPGDAEKKPGDSSSKDEQKQTPGARPDGHDQTDSLLRLASQLASDDRKQRDAGKPGFRAIGILGSDVYDKLLILRALRPMFRDVVFFTNNLDAQLSQPEEWKAAHNLVVISGFGLRLNDRWQRNIPPFRDSYQTSIYLGTLVATGEVEHDPVALSLHQEASQNRLSKIMDVPRVFEIGRNGALDLSVDNLGRWTAGDNSKLTYDKLGDDDGNVRLHPVRTDQREWWDPRVRHSTALGVWWVPASLTCCALAALAFAGLFYRSVILTRLAETAAAAPAGPNPLLAWVQKKWPAHRLGAKPLHRICGMEMRDSWRCLNEWFTLSTPVVSVAAALVAVLVVTVGYRWQWIEGEPFAWFAGLSVWPGIAIRVFALILAAHFVFKSYCRVLQSDSEILERFGLGADRPGCAAPDLPDANWTHTLVPWTFAPEINENAPDLLRARSFPARVLWCQYIWRGWWRYRVIRVSLLTALFLFTTWCAFAAFDCGLGPSPTRSALAATMDTGSLLLLLAIAVFLTLFIVDALWLNASFIKLFNSGLTRWPEDVRARTGWMNILEESEIADELDIQLIATRTAAVGEFVLYPFIIVALLVVSRAPYFDNWGWTDGLILILAALLGLAVIAGLRIRAAAEKTRKGVLARLGKARGVALTKEDDAAKKKVKGLDELIARTGAVDEGAFAPFSQQPIIKALLFPAGGVGMWELVRQLLTRF